MYTRYFIRNCTRIQMYTRVYKCIRATLYIYIRNVTRIQMSHWCILASPLFMNEFNHFYEWVLSHVRMSRVNYCLPNEWCHIYRWVLSHVQMSRVNFFSFFSNEFCHIHEWVLSHVRMSRVFFFLSNELRHRTNSVACTKETCHNKVTPRIRMSLVPCVNESCCTARELGDVSRAREHKSRDKCEWVMSHVWIESSHISKVWSRCRIHFRNATSHMWIYRFIYIRFIHMNQFMSRMWICHVTRVIDSCHTWIVCDDSCVIMPRHTREYAMSHMWIYHFIYTRFIYMNRVMSHMWTCHVTHVNISIHIHESTHVSHIHMWMGGAALMNNSCLTYTHVNGWCCTYEWVMSHIYTREWVVSRIRTSHVSHLHTWMGGVAHTNGSCRTYEWVTSHSTGAGRHCACARKLLCCFHSWGVWDMFDMTHSYVRHDSWHDSVACVTWLVCCANCLYARHDLWHGSFLYTTWLMVHVLTSKVASLPSMRFVGHAWHDSFTRATWLVTWLIYTCDMTRDMTHSHTRYDRWND